MEYEELKQVIREALNENGQSSVPSDLHAKHHEFIDMMLEKYQRRRDIADKIKAQVGGWAIIAMLAAIGSYAWSHVIDAITSLKGGK